MEILKRVINKYMPLSLGSMIALVMVANIMSCERCKKPNNTGTPGISISVKEKNLQGHANVIEELILTPDTEKVVDLTEAKLHVKLEVEGDTPANASLEFDAFVDNVENPTTEKIQIQGGTDKIELLTYFYKLGDDKTILEPTDSPLTKKFTFRPEEGHTTKMVATFQLLNKDGEPIGNSCKSTWEKENANIQLTFKNLHKFKGINVDTPFKIKNVGEKVAFKDIKIKLESDKAGMKFALGNKGDVESGNEYILEDLLGAGDIENKKVTNDISLKVTDANNHDSAQITITMTCGGKEKKTTVVWNTKNIKLTLINLKDFSGINEKNEFKIKNVGEKVTFKDVKVKLESDKVGMKFTLGKEVNVVSGNEYTLEDLLGAGDIENKKVTNDISLEVTDANNHDTAQITITVTCGGKEEKKTVTWNTKNIKLTLENLKDFSGINKARKFKIKNVGEKIALKDVKVKLESDKAGMKFTLGKEGNVESGKEYTLEELLGAGDIENKKSTNEILLKVTDINNHDTAQITITVTCGGKEEKKAIQWKKK